ncbi:MAG: hypothetical protein LBH05_04190 [Deferribacteraceae bacterium]|jgi:hypothetical protein|nr:hypothetical protein [Deferribacteraceae bacterium]
MSKIKLSITILFLLVISPIVILVGIKVYKDFRNKMTIKSDLAAVGLPTKDGYMGGTYPKWEPMEFTYKNYKGEPSIDSPEFEEMAFEKSLNDCNIFAFHLSKKFHLSKNMALEEIHKLAETDPDAMYYIAMYKMIAVIYSDYLTDVDNITAMEYLEKAASRGHVLANIDLTDYMDDEDKKQSVLDAYAKITPYAEGKRIQDILYTKDVVRIVKIAENSNQYPFILFYLDIYYEYDITLPDFDDYWCEYYFRGCVLTLPHGIKCSQ